jgi:signal transduction histidine kinase
MNLLHDSRDPRSSGTLATRLDESPIAIDATAEAARLQELGAQMAKMAHDLNNLLSPILMSLDVVRPGLEDASHLTLLDLAKKSTLRAAELVRQVLAFSRGANAETEKVDPRAIVQEIGEFAQATFPGSIGIRVDAPKTMPALSGNAAQLHRVLLNLCVNARDAMPEGGTLTLRASNVTFEHALKPAGRYILFEVSDTGSGIPETIREKIFDPFFTTKAPGKGTGLGLASVRSVVENHAGVLSLHTKPGRGTTFHILLPVFESATSPNADYVLSRP